MMNPHINCVMVHNAKVYSIETQAGVVHVIADRLFEHLSEAIHFLRGDEPNPVVAALEKEKTDGERDELLETATGADAAAGAPSATDPAAAE